MISAQLLKKSYGVKKVIDISSLTIETNSCFGLVGNNGAGKTTLFRLLLDLIKADEGFVSSFNVQIAKDESWKSYTASFLDESFLIPFLTADEYFAFFGKAYGISSQEVSSRLFPFQNFFNNEVLGEKKLIRDFSTGNKRKIGIAAAMMIHPKVLMLDEPFANLDPSSQLKLVKMLEAVVSQRKTTILISSHDLSHITKVCDRIALIEKGTIISDAPKTESTLLELEHYFST